MSRPPVPLQMLISLTAAVWAPVGFALMVLFGVGVLPGAYAAATAAGLAVVTALILRPYLGDLMALRGYVEDLGVREETTVPRFMFRGPAMETAAVIARLNRNWIKGRESLKDATAASTIVLDRLPDPLLLLDRERMIVRGNIAARDLFGPNIAGRDLSAALRNPIVLAAADQVLAGREEATVEVELPVPVEREFLAGITALPAATPDGTVAILRLHDLTEMKRTEQMRADFIANVSHELKTPLTTLVGYIETLRGPAKDDAKATERFLGIMAQQATRMNRLVDDLLSLSRIQLHEHKAPKQRVDLRRLLGSVTDLFEIKARAKDQKIELSVAPEAASETLGDPVELSQVFENLLENAVRYGAPNSTIRITVAPAPSADGATSDRISIAVADQGAGIPREHLPRLTERFYRVDPARSRELGGTGLGLAIVKHIVNRHRGDLKIESEVGKGSTFTVVLPPAPAAS